MEISFKNPSLAAISLTVITLHLGVIVWLALTLEHQVMQRNFRPLKVNTQSLFIEETKSSIPVANNVPKKTVTQKPSSNLVKKVEKKKEEKSVSKSSSSKKSVDLKRQNLLSQAQKSIQDVSSRDFKGSANSLTLPSLKLSKNLTDREISYQEELAGRLKLLLRLPEQGQVDIELTLDRQGNVKKIKILKADSRRNHEYIEHILPTLSFPPFGNRLSGRSQFVFQLTLESEQEF